MATFAHHRVERHSATSLLLLFLTVAGAGCAGGDAGDTDTAAPTDSAAAGAAMADSAPAGVADVGLMTPESVAHDTAADVYLVSNINGAPTGKDNNGFISRVSPQGELLELRWIAGGTGGATLHAPKGIALRGDSVFVADIDTLRIFNRQTGEALGGWGVAGASLLNDVSIGSDGAVYVTDTGLRGGAGGALEPSGTDAVYRFGANGEPEALATGNALGNPNGLVAADGGVIFVSFGSNAVSRLDAGGQQTTVVELPGGQLDGVVRLDDGTLLVTSWEGSAVYRVSPAGQVTTEVENVDAPADLGYDATRGRIMVPLFNENRVVFHQVR